MSTTSSTAVFGGGGTATTGTSDEIQAAIALALMGYGSAPSTQAQTQTNPLLTGGYGDGAAYAYSSYGGSTGSLSSALSSASAASASAEPVYVVTAADVNSANPWASIAQTLYGTSDAAVVAQLKASEGNPTLAVGMQLSPPVQLSYDQAQATTANLKTENFSTVPGSWGAVATLESGPQAAYAPQVAFGANGDGLSVWMQGADLMASVYTKATGTWGTATAIDGNLAGDAYLPHLSASSNGNMLVTWRQGSNLYARRYVDGHWDASSSSIPLMSDNAYYPTGAISDSGRAMVVFAESDGYRWNAVARYFDGSQWQASKVQLDDVGGANDNEVNSSLLPRVAMDAAGNATAVWVQPAVGDTVASLCVSRFDAGSGQWTAPSSTAIESAGSAVTNFRIASAANGDSVVVWQHGGLMYARNYIASNDTWGTATWFSDGATGEPALSVSANGNAIVAWTLPNDTHVYARRLVNGVWSGHELLSNSQLATARAPSAAINDSGQAIVTFLGNTGGGEHVYSNRYQDGAWGGPQQAESISTAPQKPVAAIDASGNAQVVMSLQADGVNSIYGRRYAASERQYVVPSGATWESLTQALYGTQEASAVNALKAQLATSAATPTPGQALKGLPQALNYTRQVAAHATVNVNALRQPGSSSLDAAMSQALLSMSNTIPSTPAPARAPAANATGTATVLTAQQQAQLQAQMAVQAAEQAAAQTQVDALVQQLSERQLALSSAASAAAYAQTTVDAWNRPLTGAPHGRPQEQWDAIGAVWADRNDEPAYLMQLMVDYGFDAYDIAYVTGQSIVQVGQYLANNGAFDGFASWSQSGYQAMLASAGEAQTKAQQATLARNQAQQALQAAQVKLNALTAQAAQLAAQQSQAAAPAPSSTAVFGGGGVPSSTGAANAASSAALALMGYGMPPPAAALVQATSQSSSVANTLLTTAPRQRSEQQWADIKAVWNDRNDEPQRLMQLMRDYGFDVADIAYATGQTLAQVGGYLLSHGAADGFANWTAAGGYTGAASASATGSAQTSSSVLNNPLMNQVLTAPPRQRPAEQWADIKAVWNDRNDEPLRLMDLMRSYGFDVADLAYATGQTLAQVGGYLLSHGAADGFANWTAATGYTGTLGSSSTTGAPSANSLRMTNILVEPPHQLTQQQWSDIKAVWEDRKDEPPVLMDLMRTYGFDAADLAYATGQSLAQVGGYLLSHGALDGFAGWSASKGYLGSGAVKISPTATHAYPAPHPQERAGALWPTGTGAQSVAAIWQQYRADPYRLMQTMAEYGISAQELAQASGQSLQDIGIYLSRAGAPVGFAGADIIDRISVDSAFLVALDAASYPFIHEGSGSSTFDVQAFTAWYAAQNTPASRDFATLHGADFSKTQANAVAGHWEGNGDAGMWVWRGAQIAYQGATKDSQHLITGYLNYSQADEQELLAADFTLHDELSQQLLAHFGSNIGLPQSEFVERMRARYGSERATQMYRVQQANQALRAAYAAALAAEEIHPPSLAQFQAEAPGVALDSQNIRYVSTSRPWWSITQHLEHDNNHETLHLDLQAFTTWYASQNTVASRLFEQVYGSKVTTVEYQEGLGEGDSYQWGHSYIGAGGASEILMGHWEDVGDQDRVWVPAALAGHGFATTIVSLDPQIGKVKLFDGEAMTFDPVMGFVTAHENIDNRHWTDAIPGVVVGVVAGVIIGPAAAELAGYAGNVVVSAGFGAAAGTIFTGLMNSGRIDLKEVFKSAISAMLTAGFAEYIGANTAGVSYAEDGARVVKWAERLPAIGGQAVFNGLVSEIMGGKFAQGFAQSLANQLGNEIMQSIRADLNTRNIKLAPDQEAAYTLMGRGISAALTIAANPKNPQQTLAYAFISAIATELGTAIGNINAGASNRVARDDEGNVMPGVVNLFSTEAQQRLQLYNQLRLQGLSPGEASSIVHEWVDSGAQALFNTTGGVVGGVNTTTGAITDTAATTVLPNAGQAAAGLMDMNDERFTQLVDSMAMAGDLEGLQLLAVLMEGEAQLATRNANALGVIAAQEQYLMLLARTGQLNAAAQGIRYAPYTAPGVGLPGMPSPDPTDRSWQSLPPFSGATIQWRDLVNIQPADWPGWAKAVLVRLQISALELARFAANLPFPMLIAKWNDSIYNADNSGDTNTPSFIPSRTNPTGQMGSTAWGEPKVADSDATASSKADTAAENEALDVTAVYGYKTERNPILTVEERTAQGLSPSTNPDARIEGKVFDVKASKTAQGAEKAIEDSVNHGQSRRFIISTNHFTNPDQGARELAARLKANPISGLQEVKVIVNGVLRNIYP